MARLAAIRQYGLAGWQRGERVFDTAFGSARNPLRHLGALALLCLWLLALSGIYLYAVIDTSAEGAYRSIHGLALQPWYALGWLRSLHRYAADAFVLLMALHLAREWLHGHYQGIRRFSWLTGVPLILFGFASAIGGFWLNWDQLGQFSAIATAEWLDALPLLATPLVRNFLSVGAVGDRLFSLFVFVHLGVALLMIFGLWFHVQRLTRAAVFPPRPLALATFGLLVALALGAPITSHPPANAGAVPAALALDWILLFLHPLTYATSAGAVWWGLSASLLLLLALPFLPQPPRAPVARVDAANCNGCRRCFDDCPYAAVTMLPHPNGKPGKELARVDADLCIGCGICAGACPSSTPFRGAAELVSGIDMPQLTVGTLRRRLRQGLGALRAERPIVVFGCDRGARVECLAGADVAAFSLICTGMLPPSFVDYALRDGAAGVLVSGCAEGSCEFRLGQRWAAARLQGRREPRLRTLQVPERLEVAWAGAADPRLLGAPRWTACASGCACFPPPAQRWRQTMADAHAAPATKATTGPPGAAAWAGQALLYALFALFIGVFSRWPTHHPLGPDQALIKLSFTHTSKPVGDCRALSQAELAKLPPNMRAPLQCPRGRSPVTVEVDIGGVPALRRVLSPSGLSNDGASAVYQRLQVAAGEQRIAVRLNDDARRGGFTHQREATVTLAPAQILVIDFDAEQGGITLR